MTREKISEYDAVAANNTDVNGVNIAENCPPSGMNNMGREIMAALKRFQTGADGDSVTVGGSLVVSGTATTNTLTAGPVSATTLNTSGAVVFNDSGADVDFRVEGDTDANLLFVDASTDRVGVGTNTPGAKFHIVTSTGGSATGLAVQKTGQNFFQFYADTNNTDGVIACAGAIRFDNGSGTERMRIDSSGNLLVGTTTANPHASGAYGTQIYGGGLLIGTNNNVSIIAARWNANGEVIRLQRNDVDVGSIDVTTTATSYNTSSDYRLKENIVPMTGALAKVLELNPCTYTWKIDGSAGEGFIAHELQAVCPEAVSGTKDGIEIQQVEVSPAVEATYDEEGNELTPAVEAVYEEREVPVYQGVDTSFLVATLTAAIQELKAELDAAKQRIAALENA